MAESAIDPGNWQAVTATRDAVWVTLPSRRMTRDQALLHAAWLVAMAEMLPGDLTFEGALRAVRST